MRRRRGSSSSGSFGTCSTSRAGASGRAAREGPCTCPCLQCAAGGAPAQPCNCHSGGALQAHSAPARCPPLPQRHLLPSHDRPGREDAGSGACSHLWQVGGAARRQGGPAKGRGLTLVEWPGSSFLSLTDGRGGRSWKELWTILLAKAALLSSKASDCHPLRRHSSAPRCPPACHHPCSAMDIAAIQQDTPKVQGALLGPLAVPAAWGRRRLVASLHSVIRMSGAGAPKSYACAPPAPTPFSLTHACRPLCPLRRRSISTASW